MANQSDIRIHAFIDERNVEIFIDTSGEALFKRGYRQDTGEAPLRENLAAGLLLWQATTVRSLSKTRFAVAVRLPLRQHGLRHTVRRA